MQRPPPDSRSDVPLAVRLAAAQAGLAVEAPGSLDSMAALALDAWAAGEPTIAASAASTVVLVEHLTSARYRHSADMLDILARAGPGAADGPDGPDGLVAWAGAAVAHDYGVLPSWPAADVPWLLEAAHRAPADVAFMLACALGEICERNGDDAGFAILQAQMAGVAARGAVSPLWRGHWAVVCAWHLASFGKHAEALVLLAGARALAAEHGLRDMGAAVDLQCARLAAWDGDPAKAQAMADRAVAAGDPSRTPIWFADQADVRCRLALRAQDFHAAVGHGRRAVGYLHAGRVWPGYQLIYRVNEAYALLGVEAFEAAIDRLAALCDWHHPRYLMRRLECLSLLARLIAADRVGPWNADHQGQLVQAIRLLRELEWPNVMRSLPGHVARLFVRALETGVEVEWVRATIRTRNLPAPPQAPESWPWAVRVRVFGRFVVSTANDHVHGGRKAASKPLELLRLLAAHGHGAVRVDVIAESLWPGDRREGRQKAFEVTLARLRRLLDCDDAVLVHDHRVQLNGAIVWSDVQAFDDQLARSEAAAAGSAEGSGAVAAALQLYRGACLADTVQPWALAAALPLRERLGAALLHEVRHCSESEGRESMLRATAADPLLGTLLAQAR